MNQFSKFSIILLLSLLVIGGLFRLIGYSETWQLWNVPTMDLHFADVRVITHASESIAAGKDPLIENIADPWGRQLNYPRVWQSLLFLGINEKHTTLLGFLFISLFLAGVILFIRGLKPTNLLIFFPLLLSPAVMMGVERANTDLLIFFLLSLIVIFAKKRANLAMLTIGIASILKLYPIFATGVFLILNRKKALTCIFICSCVMVLYCVMTFSDILKIREVTPIGVVLGYGARVFQTSVGEIYYPWLYQAKVLTIAGIAFIGIRAVTLFNIRLRVSSDVESSYEMNGFRVGSCVFLGTFLVGTNWDYRMMILLFTVPQLWVWAKNSMCAVSMQSKATLVFISFSLWSMFLAQFTRGIPYGPLISFVLDEFSNWFVFASLLFLLIRSLPEWVFEIFSSFQKTVIKLQSR